MAPVQGFDRSRTLTGRSFAAARYRADSTEINTHYWISRLAEGGLQAATRKLPIDVKPELALQIPRALQGRVAERVSELETKMGVSSRWRRLLILVMLSSALERYMAAITHTALESDPSLTPGFPKIVDGALLAKYGLTFQAPDISGITTGPWSQRLSTYKRLFDAVPPELAAAESELEFLRTRRNRIAHALGVDDGFSDEDKRHHSPQFTLDVLLGSKRPSQLDQVRVSDDRIVALLASAQRVVDSVDQHLRNDYIGAYEVISLYLQWSRDSTAFERRAGLEIGSHVGPDQRFRKVLGALVTSRGGNDYVQELKAYVKAL